MTKKNSTIIVLTIMLISVFALNSFAFCEIYDGGNLGRVTIIRKLLRGGAPKTQEAVLETCSSTMEHVSYVSVGCYTCGDWVSEISPELALYPHSVNVGKTYSNYCWNNENPQDHCAALYDVFFND